MWEFHLGRSTDGTDKSIWKKKLETKCLSVPPGLSEQKLWKKHYFPLIKKKKNHFRDVASSQITHIVTTTGLLRDLTSNDIIEDSLSMPFSGLFSESCKNGEKYPKIGEALLKYLVSCKFKAFKRSEMPKLTWEENNWSHFQSKTYGFIWNKEKSMTRLSLMYYIVSYSKRLEMQIQSWKYIFTNRG